MELNRSNSSTFLTEVDDSAWIRKRTNLEKSLIIFIILAGCSTLGFFIHIVKLGIEKKETCSTSSCVLLASQILSQVDSDLDPCEDFFRYACGKIVNSTAEEHHPTRLLENKFDKQLLNLLLEPVNKNDHPIVNYEKELYQACIADPDGAQAFEKLKKIFEDLTGWPVVVGVSWNENKFDWIDMVPKFHKNGLYSIQILRYYLEIDNTDKTRKILTIHPPFTYITGGNIETYKKLLIETAISFGANETDAHQEMTQVIDFIISIEKLKEEYEDRYDELQSRARVADFQQVHKEIDWLKYFSLLIEPASKLQPDDYFTFSNVDLVKALIDLVQSTPKRIVANYMFWSAVHELLPILNTEILSLYNDHTCSWSFTRKTHSEVCRDLIKDNFSPLSSFIAYTKKYLTIKSKNSMKDILDRIKTEFKNLLGLSTWMSKENKQTVEDNFNAMNDIIGFEEKPINHSVYHDFFKNKLTAKDGFLSMYLNFKLAMDTVFNKKLSNHDWISDFTDVTYIPKIEATYLPYQNVLVLPLGAVQDWYYDEDKPMYMKFATLGKNIASVFVKMMTGIRHTSQEGEIDWTKKTEKGFKEKTSCISERNMDNPMTQYYSYIKLEVGEIAGLKIAYNAYKVWMKENGEELPPTGTEYTPSQLFWISALTDSCYKDDYGFTLYQHNEPFKQNPNFAEDFRCYSHDKMNPSRKCNVL